MDGPRRAVVFYKWWCIVHSIWTGAWDKGGPGTMIWAEKKLFWVFWFISFIMQIEMQNRVIFSNLVKKFWKKSWFILQNWCDSIWYWVKLQYKKSYFMSYLLCWRCLEMFVKRFEYFFVSELPGMQGSIPVLTCSMWKNWFSKQNFETQFEFESICWGLNPF